MNSAVDADGLERLMEALEEALLEIGQFLASSGDEPGDDSVAARELVAFSDRDLVLTAYSQGEILTGVASEQITCFIRACAEPALTIATWSTVRAVIESCALASWLLDPNIDVRTRVKRSFAFRFDGLEQQLRMARAADYPGSVEASSKRITDVEQRALAVGFDKLVDGKGKRTGIGQVMPSVTTLVREMLNEEAAYRLLSAVTHAHNWALQQVSYQIVHDRDAPAGLKVLQKVARPVCFQYLTQRAMKAFTTPALYKTRLYGWNRELLGEIIRVHNQRVNELAKEIEFKPEGDEAG
jgi:hypothetical protein